MEEYGLIYKATNKINGKAYVGQTIQGLKTRKLRHIRDSVNGSTTVFAKAIRKYTPLSFEWEIIDKAQNATELSIKEHYWINMLNTCVHFPNSNGYNMLTEGIGKSKELNPNSKLTKELIVQIIDIAKTGNYTIPEIAKEYDVARGTINNIFNLNSAWNDVVKEILSSVELQEINHILANNGKRSLIEHLKVIKKKENHHMWGKKGKDNPNSKAVYQIDVGTNEIINEFPSASSAADNVNASSCSKIAMVCRGERKTAYGFKWKYVNKEAL